MNLTPLRYITDAIPLLAIALTAVFMTGCGEAGSDHDHAEHSQAEEPTAAAILAAHKHDVATETCFMCDASKRDKGRLWCKEHVRYEDRCWLCHPEIEEKDRLFCKEHSLYEDECFLCHPELKTDKDASDQSSQIPADAQNQLTSADVSGHEHAAGDGLFCNEHGVAEIECGICQPDLAATLKPGASLKVRFPSVNSAEKAGVVTSVSRTGASTPGINALCEVQYNLNAMARITPLAGGVIRSVQHDVGDVIAAGDVLVELHSPEVASAKSAYLSALVERDFRQQSFERAQRLREQNLAAEKDYLEAQAANRAGQLSASNLRQQLINLGFNELEIKQIQEEQDTSAKLVVRAPFAGTIVERDVVVGEAVNTGKPVFTIADLSSRWLMLSIPSAHITQVQRGQNVTARFEELPGVDIQGQITWIDTAVDSQSRMVKARALVTQNTAQIKTGLFGRAQVILGQSQPATIVPRDAIQRHENGTFVFVRNDADLFSLRSVALGQSTGQSVEVLAGLSPTESVVVQGSFVVMSEFLKSRLGAGCADH